MKKIFAILLIALVAVSAVFAVEPGAGLGVGTGAIKKDVDANQGAKTVIKAVIDPADVSGYKIGFAPADNVKGDWTSNHDMTILPAGDGVTEIDISEGYDPTTSIITNTDFGFYYKIKAVKSVTLTLSGTKLTEQNGDGTTIDYTVAVNKGTGSVTTASSGTEWSDTITLSPEAPFKADGYKMTITTEELTADMAGTFKADLTLKIASVS